MGAGKSALTRLLGQWIEVTDCDNLNARLLEDGQPGWQALRKKGCPFFDAQGHIDKAAMARAMFSDQTVRQEVEAILHPLIVKAMEDWMDRQSGLCAVEVPLLFEIGLADRFDEVWTVASSFETAMDRLTGQRGFTPEQAAARLAAQMDPESKAQMADVVIVNDGSLEELEQIARKLLEERGMDCGRA